MRWRGRRQSSNIEDRRGSGMRLPSRRSAAAGGVGGVGLLVVVVVIGMALGIDPAELLSGAETQADVPAQGSSATGAGEDEMSQFVAVVLQETEDLWNEVFEENGLEYEEPTLVLYSVSTPADRCGLAEASTGPFYCPADGKIYIDLTFYDQLRERFGAPGDLAQAYVLAHEVGHHVQQLTGVLPEFNEARSRLDQAEENAWSVRVELQADCYAGIWAAYAGQENLLEDGDIEEALNAAMQVGDDAIQERTQGYVVPKTFNHGTSEQRRRWFETGYRSGDVGACDTFAADRV